MSGIRELTVNDLPELYPIIVENEPFMENIGYDLVVREFKNREGWAIINDDNQIVGCITVSDFVPLLKATLHVCISKEYRGTWATLHVLRTIFGHMFRPDRLCLRKVYGYAIPYVTYDAAKFLTDMGFRVWGIDSRGGMTLDGKYYDIIRYEMLREECPWIMGKKEMREWLRNKRGGGQ